MLGFDHKVALKLKTALTTTESNAYLMPLSLEEDSVKDLRKSGAEFPVEVRLIGEIPFNTIIATKGNPMFRGPLPEVTDGEKEKVVRNWLEFKGICRYPVCAVSLPRPQASPRTSTIGRSATRHHRTDLFRKKLTRRNKLQKNLALWTHWRLGENRVTKPV